MRNSSSAAQCPLLFGGVGCSLGCVVVCMVSLVEISCALEVVYCAVYMLVKPGEWWSLVILQFNIVVWG